MKRAITTGTLIVALLAMGQGQAEAPSRSQRGVRHQISEHPVVRPVYVADEKAGLPRRD